MIEIISSQAELIPKSNVLNLQFIWADSAGTQSRTSGSMTNGTGSMETLATGVGALRLVLPKSKETIWAYEYKPEFLPHSRNASGSVADKVVDRLLKDAKEAEK